MKLPQSVRYFLRSWWVWVAAILPVFLICMVALALFGVIGGCATFDYQWEKRHAPMTKIVVVQVDDTDRICRQHINAAMYGRVTGCAVRDYAANVCTIYLPLTYPAWLEKHERRHCLAGEDHP
jgi:hypothetical protein